MQCMWVHMTETSVFQHWLSWGTNTAYCFILFPVFLKKESNQSKSAYHPHGGLSWSVEAITIGRHLWHFTRDYCILIGFAILFCLCFCLPLDINLWFLPCRAIWYNIHACPEFPRWINCSGRVQIWCRWVFSIGASFRDCDCGCLSTLCYIIFETVWMGKEVRGDYFLSYSITCCWVRFCCEQFLPSQHVRWWGKLLSWHTQFTVQICWSILTVTTSTWFSHSQRWTTCRWKNQLIAKSRIILLVVFRWWQVVDFHSFINCR